VWKRLSLPERLVVVRNTSDSDYPICQPSSESVVYKLILACLAVAVAVSVPVVASGPSINEGIKPGKVEGTITAVDVAAGKVTITTVRGVAVTVTTTATTKIERNDRRVTLAAFKIGDRGQALYDANKVASKVEATGP
jgi:YbbR domain-containing protein